MIYVAITIIVILFVLLCCTITGLFVFIKVKKLTIEKEIKERNKHTPETEKGATTRTKTYQRIKENDSEGNVGDVFVKKEFLTEHEIKFYYMLKNILPEMNIMCQVSLGALLRNSTNFWKRGFFDQKIADFVITDQKLKVVAIIELDDPSHDAKGRREKDEKRDAMLQSAGYRTLRYDGRMLPEEEEIRYDIIAA